MREQEGSALLTNKLFYLFLFILAHTVTHHFYTRISSHSQANPLINTQILHNIHLPIPEWWDKSPRVTKVQVKQVRMPTRNWTWEDEMFQQIHLSIFFSALFPYNAQ